jgi:hypothetical protein
VAASPVLDLDADGLVTEMDLVMLLLRCCDE